MDGPNPNNLGNSHRIGDLFVSLLQSRQAVVCQLEKVLIVAAIEVRRWSGVPRSHALSKTLL